MGLDVYIIPFEKELTVEAVKNDSNLTIEEFDGSRVIKLTSNPESSILQYSKDRKTIFYVRVYSKSLPIIRYIAETYGALIGADGFLSDAGYRLMRESEYCENDEELNALTFGYLAGEMLEYDSEYQWSYEFKAKLENELNRVRETYNTVVERIEAELSAENDVPIMVELNKQKITDDDTPF